MKFKDFTQFIEEFKKYYSLEFIECKWEGNYYLHRDDKIYIIVYEDRILAESAKSFNKWSQAYLKMKIPRNSKSFNKLLFDLKEITKPEHIKLSDGFNEYVHNNLNVYK